MDNEVIAGLIGFGGAVVGAAMMLLGQGWFDRRARGRHARYLAIRVGCVLDKYVEECAGVVEDDGLPDEQGSLVPQADTPSPPAFPDDLDWKSIDHELMYEILSLPTKAEAADQMIGAASEHAFPPDWEEAFEERQRQYSELGLAALTLAREIRRKYAIPEQPIHVEWNPGDRLAAGKARIEEQRRKRLERLAKSTNDLIGGS